MSLWIRNLIIAVILPGITAGLALAAKGPLKVEVEPTKRIYSSREGVMVKFVFTAREKIRLCLQKDFLSQMTLEISRSGKKLPLQPLVITDNSALFRERARIYWLGPGESVTLRANLRRYRFDNEYQWEPAEYTVNGTFNLCSQTGGEEYSPMETEIPIRFEHPGWFMIMS